MSDKAVSTWRSILLIVVSLVASGGVALSSWSIREIFRLDKELSNLKASLPVTFPPPWFVEQNAKDHSELKASVARLAEKLDLNHDLLVKMQYGSKPKATP